MTERSRAAPDLQIIPRASPESQVAGSALSGLRHSLQCLSSTPPSLRTTSTSSGRPSPSPLLQGFPRALPQLQEAHRLLSKPFYSSQHRLCLCNFGQKPAQPSARSRRRQSPLTALAALPTSPPASSGLSLASRPSEPPLLFPPPPTLLLSCARKTTALWIYFQVLKVL